MPRYFFHLREPGRYVRDEEGTELSDLDAAGNYALDSARAIIAHEVREHGLIPLSHIMEVEDEAGAIVRTLSYVEAVTLV